MREWLLSKMLIERVERLRINGLGKQNRRALRTNQAQMVSNGNLLQIGRRQGGMAVWADDSYHGELLLL
jgi:hypothetical protein